MCEDLIDVWLQHNQEALQQYRGQRVAIHPVHGLNAMT